MKEPRLTGQLGGENLRYQRTTLRTLRTQLDLGSSGIALRQGRLQTSSQGRVEFDMTVGLRNWSYERENPVSLRVVTNRLPVADVQQAANLQYPITGNSVSQCLGARIANKPRRPGVGSAVGGSRLGPTDSGSLAAISGHRERHSLDLESSHTRRIRQRESYLLPQRGRIRGASRFSRHTP